MICVYPVEHTYRTQEGYLESKFIGVYSSLQRARAAIGRLAARTGFKDRPEGFEVRSYVVGQDHWADGYTSEEPPHEIAQITSTVPEGPSTLMAHVHVLWHWYETDRGNDVVKFIGVYTSDEDGRKAADRLMSKPGFRDRPDHFDLQRYQLDKDHWEEGYISVQEALESLQEAPEDGPERRG